MLLYGRRNFQLSISSFFSDNNFSPSRLVLQYLNKETKFVREDSLRLELVSSEEICKFRIQALKINWR